jgi:glycerol kinase
MSRMTIGLDIGSSSLKALRLDDRGRPAGAARRPIVTRRRSGGRVEHDADEIARAAVAALRSAAGGRAPSGPHDLGIATQRSTVLFWDRGSGRPLTPAYSWQDLRGAAWCARLRRGERGRNEGDGVEARIAARTGLRLSPHYAASKLAWALQRVPGLRRQVASGRALWGTLGSFLLYRLSGGAAYAIDHANAQRTLLFDLESRSWDPGLLALFGLEPLLDAPALPALLPTCPAAEIVLPLGRLRFRLRAMTGDQQAALVGLGARRLGVITVNYGSGAFVLFNVGPRPVRVPGLLTSLLASWHDPGGRSAAWYAVEGTVNSAATALEWVQRRLGLRVRTAGLDRYLGGMEGAPAIHFLPAIAGLGAPRWDPRARPRFAGRARGAGPRDLLRAAVESIAQRCAEIVRAAEAGARRSGGPALRGPALPKGAPVLAAGGLTRSRTLLQLQADLLQRPVIVRDSPDATAIGAALLASVPARRLFADRPAARAESGGAARVIRPRLQAAEAVARHRAWRRAVYGPGRAGAAVGRGAGAGGDGLPPSGKR